MNFRSCTIALSWLLILTLGAANALAQDEDDLAKIQQFEGGRIDLRLGAASFALLGPSAAGLQTSVAPVFPGPGRHLHNPALLALTRRVMLAADAGPALGLDLAGPLDLDAELADASEELLADQLAEDGIVNSSRSHARLEHPGGLSAASITLPSRPAQIAFSMDRAFNLDLSLFATGVQSWVDIEKEVGEGTETVNMRADLDLSARLQMLAQRYSVAVGRTLRPGLWAGAGVDYLRCLARVDALADVEGIMATSGREFGFGDPSDPWENSLDQSLHGRYAGDTWLLRLGAGWRPLPRLACGLSWQRSAPLELAGSADLELRRLVAYADGGIDPGSLSLSQPTETEAVASPVDERLSLRFPGSVTLGIATWLGPFNLTVDGSLYTGQFSLSYLDAAVELRPRGLVKLGLYSRHFSLSAGALLLKPSLRIDGETNNPGLVPMPLVTLGGGRRIGRHLQLDGLLTAAPLPSLRVSGTLLF